MHRDIRTKIRVVAHLSAGLFAFGILAPISYMYFDRRPPVEITSIQMTPAIVKPGEKVLIKWGATTKRLCPGTVYRQWVDAGGTIHIAAPISAVGRFVIQGSTFTQELTIPGGMAAGVGYMTGWREYYCNWVQRYFPIVLPMQRLPFIVLPQDSSGN